MAANKASRSVNVVPPCCSHHSARRWSHSTSDRTLFGAESPTCAPRKFPNARRSHAILIERMVGISSADKDSLIGSRLGKNYLVRERIGVGGMAVVYLVEHITLHKQFAVKVLSSEHASSAEARARFTQEAHA